MTFMTFEEFLKKTVLESKPKGEYEKGYLDSQKDFKKALGKWAYSQMEFWDIQCAFSEPYKSGHIDFAERIAKPCLGEEEVEKLRKNYLKKKELEKKEWEKRQQELNAKYKKQNEEFAGKFFGQSRRE